MPYIRVVYKTNKFDYVSGDLLDALIAMEEITHFYRTSENRWIDVKFDPIRGKGGCYKGRERRKAPSSEGQEAEKGFSKAKRPQTNWFECFMAASWGKGLVEEESEIQTLFRACRTNQAH